MVLHAARPRRTPRSQKSVPVKQGYQGCRLCESSSIEDKQVPYEILQAVWSHGSISHRDKTSLALACSEHVRILRPWLSEAIQRHMSQVHAYDIIYRVCYKAGNAIHVSDWGKILHEQSIQPSYVNIYIDDVDESKLSDICSWLGHRPPRQLLFRMNFEHRKRCKALLTDAMLFAVCTKS